MVWNQIKIMRNLKPAFVRLQSLTLLMPNMSICNFATLAQISQGKTSHIPGTLGVIGGKGHT